MRSVDDNDFFESDEDVRDVLAAFNRGTKGATSLPGGARWSTAPTSCTTGSTDSRRLRLPAALPFPHAVSTH